MLDADRIVEPARSPSSALDKYRPRPAQEKLDKPIINRIRAHVLGLPRRWKQIILIIMDFFGLAFALWASFCLRYDNWYAPHQMALWAPIFVAPLVAIPVFIRMGLYRAVVRYLPERAMWTMVQAMLIATVGWLVLMFLSEISGRGVVPRSVPIIYFGLGTFFIAGSRFAAKWIFLPPSARRAADRKAVLIYGAGEAGIQLALSLAPTHHVVGFLDDNAALQKREMSGIKVYSPERLSDLVRDYGVSDVILSIPSLNRQRRREIIDSVSLPGLKIRMLPPIADLVAGKYLVNQIKEIDIVELLGRSSVPPDPELIRAMTMDRVVMVTGAGGSIGSELCRKIARWAPKKLVLFEANEFALYQIEQELADITGVAVVPVLGSVTDAVRVRETIEAHGIKVLFHAAAHKHVPLVEANALEGIRNNVFGTRIVADAAFEAGVEHFVLISTDKAVRPTNVMGATKRWAELIVAEKANAAHDAQTGQRFCAVRFGNVLGSNGSVVPLFKKQIAQGGPITLTDLAMTRYFMSIPEAAELIVQAGALSEGGDIFLLDMGEPMLILDLAKNMVRLAGLTVRDAAHPGGDIEIVVTGKRPGEKLYEELFYDAGAAQPTDHPKITKAPRIRREIEIPAVLHALNIAVEQRDEPKARKILFDIVEMSGGANE